MVDGEIFSVMGVSFYPGLAIESPGDLVKVAEQALERARAEGPGSYCLVQNQAYIYRPSADLP